MSIHQKLADGPPHRSPVSRLLAGHHLDLGVVLWRTGKSSEAESEYRDALTHFRKLADEQPAVTKVRSELARTHFYLASLLASMTRTVEAKDEVPQRRRDSAEAGRRPPHRGNEFRNQLANFRMGLGGLLGEMGERTEHADEFRKALEIQQRLVHDNPTIVGFRWVMASTRYNLANLLAAMGKPSEAHAEYRESIAVSQKLVDENPAFIEFQRHLALACKQLARSLRDNGARTASLSYFRRAVEVQRHAADTSPLEGSLRDYLGWYETDYAMALREAGRLGESFHAARGRSRSGADGSSRPPSLRAIATTWRGRSESWNRPRKGPTAIRSGWNRSRN